MTRPLSNEQRRLLEVMAEEVGLNWDCNVGNLTALQDAMGYTTLRRTREAVEALVRAGLVEAKKAGRTNYRRYIVKDAA